MDYKDAKDLNKSEVVDLKFVANNFYIKDDKILISSKDYGVKIYSLKNWELLKDIQHIGKNIDNPYTSDGTTLNYTSSGDIKVFFLSDSFSDGVSSNPYTISDNITSNEGCFIATAAYGSYFQKHVKTLRDFRDRYLLTNYLGKKFVKLYYKYSPDIASKISKSPTAKAVVRAMLMPIVYLIEYPLVAMLVFGFLGLYFIRKIVYRKKIRAVSYDG
jgi:hypothetical protein